jgi:hypothetical protein
MKSKLLDCRAWKKTTIMSVNGRPVQSQHTLESLLDVIVRLGSEAEGCISDWSLLGAAGWDF